MTARGPRQLAWLLAATVVAAGSAFAPAPALAEDAPLSPEIQLSLQHLREGERERLRRAVGPLDEMPLYRLQLDVQPEERTASGRVQIVQAAVGAPMEALHLRVTANTLAPNVKLSHATLNGQPAVMLQPEPTLYQVLLDPPVAPGALALVEVQLQATIPEAPPDAPLMLGAMAQTAGPRDYGAFAASPHLLMLSGILPQVPPVDAVGRPWAGPSGLGDMALFEPSHVLTSITVPSRWRVLTSGVALGEVPEKDGRVRYSFAATAVRDFPVVVARGYQKKQAEEGGMTVESWYAAGNEKSGRLALDLTRATVRELQKRIGPLPYRTLRVVEAPLSGGAGGMEFSGLFVVSSTLYRALIDPAEAMGLPPGFSTLLGAQGNFGQVMRDTFELTIAHEVAHQYFAGLVGSDPVAEPVVDEALAQYTALLYFEWRYGKAAYERIRQQHLVGAYHVYRLQGGRDGPASRPTSEFGGSPEYAALVYGKAPLFHHAARKLVGDPAYFKALRRYVDAFRYRWACRTCFTDELAKQKPEKAKALRALRTRWWDEAHGDEDLGRPSIANVYQGMTGESLDPEAARLLQEMIRQLTGE